MTNIIAAPIMSLSRDTPEEDSPDEASTFMIRRQHTRAKVILDEVKLSLEASGVEEVFGYSPIPHSLSSCCNLCELSGLVSKSAGC